MAVAGRPWSVLLGVSVTLVLALVIQLVPYGHDRTNPVTVLEPRWDSDETRSLAKRACFDCHSNETNWPAYASLAPASWLIAHDVLDGRETLNLSEWQRPQEESRKSAEEVREGEMPPRLYRWMHPEARLSDAERERLARGLAATLGDGGDHD